MDNATKLFKDSEFVKFTDIVPSKPLNPIVKSELMLVLKRDDIQITADYYADGATWTISSPQYKDLVLCEAWTDYGIYNIYIAKPHPATGYLCIASMNWFGNGKKPTMAQKDILDVFKAVRAKQSTR